MIKSVTLVTALCVCAILLARLKPIYAQTSAHTCGPPGICDPKDLEPPLSTFGKGNFAYCYSDDLLVLQCAGNDQWIVHSG